MKTTRKYTKGGKGLTDISGDGEVTKKDLLMKIGAILSPTKKPKRQIRGRDSKRERIGKEPKPP